MNKSITDLANEPPYLILGSVRRSFFWLKILEVCDELWKKYFFSLFLKIKLWCSPATLTGFDRIYPWYGRCQCFHIKHNVLHQINFFSFLNSLNERLKMCFTIHEVRKVKYARGSQITYKTASRGSGQVFSFLLLLFPNSFAANRC